MRTWTNCYGRPYKIVRVFCPTHRRNGVAAYTNCVILNKKVLVPTFSISGDAAALQIYRDAHARLRGPRLHREAGSPTTRSTAGPWESTTSTCCGSTWRRFPDTVATPGDIRLSAVIDDRSEAGLKATPSWPTGACRGS